MGDIIKEVENRQRATRMSQAEIARQLGVSQGQLSKVLAGKVPLTKKMSNRMAVWLARTGSIEAVSAQEILKKCIELMHLIRRHINPNDVSSS